MYSAHAMAALSMGDYGMLWMRKIITCENIFTAIAVYMEKLFHNKHPFWYLKLL